MMVLELLLFGPAHAVATPIVTAASVVGAAAVGSADVVGCWSLNSCFTALVIVLFCSNSSRRYYCSVHRYPENCFFKTIPSEIILPCPCTT